jgi:hypothetical protein
LDFLVLAWLSVLAEIGIQRARRVSSLYTPWFYLIFCLSFQIHRRFTDALTLVIKNSEGCNISPNKRKSMVVALNGSHYGASQDFLADDLLDISKENEIENAAVSEAERLSTHIIARKLTSHASYTTSLFPRITQV